MNVSSVAAISYKPNCWASQHTLDQHTLLCTVWPQYLSLQEACDIIKQFDGEGWLKDKQVLWSGMTQSKVHKIANKYGVQTLRDAMGPLMDPDNPSCLKSQKSSLAWSKYIKGASLIFAWRISKGEVATIITPPPPYRFHPSEKTNLQDIEIPVLQGCLGNRPVSRILLWHPTIKGAESFRYQFWPVDHTSSWHRNFEPVAQKHLWRRIGKHRASTKWAVPSNVRHPNFPEMFVLLKRTLLEVVKTIVNVWNELTLLINLSAYCILILAKTPRLFVQILFLNETDLHETGQIEPQLSSSQSGLETKTTDVDVLPGGSGRLQSGAKQTTEVEKLKAGEVEQISLHSSDASTTPILADCLTRDIHSTTEKQFSPIMVPMESVESSTPVKRKVSLPKHFNHGKRDLKKLKKNLRRCEAMLAAQRSSNTMSQSAVGA